MNEISLTAISKQLEELTKRVKQLELKVLATTSPVGRIVQEAQYPNADTATALPYEAIRLPTASPEVKEEVKESIEKISTTSTLLGTVAVFCFILAGAFFIKLSIESGWLTPLRQVCIAALTGSGFVIAGFMLRERDLKYASYLPGTGIAILFLTTYALRFVYRFEFATVEVVSALSIAVALYCLVLYRYFRSDFFPVVAAFGTYMVPLLLGGYRYSPVAISLFYLLWSFLFSTMASILQTRTLSLVSAYFGIGTFSIIMQESRFGDHAAYAGMMLPFVQLAQLLIFGSGLGMLALYSGSSLTRSSALNFVPIIIWFYGSEFSFLYRQYSSFAAWIMVAIAVLAMGLYFALQRLTGKTLHSWVIVEMLLGLTFFHAIYTVLVPGDLQPLLAVGFTAMYFSSLRKYLTLFWWKIGLYLILIISSCKILIGLLTYVPPQGMYWAFYGATFALSAILAGLGSIFESKAQKPYLLFLGHVFGVVTLFYFTKEIGSFAVSFSWAIYALSILGLGFSFCHKVLAKSSLYILLFSVGKVLLYDLSGANTLVRIFCLLLTGSLLYVHGLILRKIEELKD